MLPSRLQQPKGPKSALEYVFSKQNRQLHQRQCQYIQIHGRDGTGREGKGRGNLRDVDETLLLHRELDVVGQGAGDLGGVTAADVAVDALPLGDPRLLGVGDGDQALEDLGGALVDRVRVASQLEEGAVRAALLLESLFRKSR